MSLGEGARLAESDKLRGADNYIQWADEVQNILMSKGLEDYIEASCIKPEEVDTTNPILYTSQQAEIKA